MDSRVPCHIRIKEAMDEIGYRAVDLVEKTGINKATISQYLSGKYEPSQDRLEILAKVLNKPEAWLIGYDVTDRLIFRTVDFGENIAGKSSLDWTYSIQEKYNALDTHGKEVVSSLLDAEYDRIQKEKGKPTPPPVLEKIPTRKLPVENSLASAGVGYELLDDLGKHEYIIVQDTAENAKAHFAVQVTGDSMEPMIHSGDYILICTTAPVDLHGIGLFVIDGEGMVKKFGGDTLISLNSKYEPRPYKSAYEDGECRCVGKVVNIIHDYDPEEFEE